MFSKKAKSELKLNFCPFCGADAELIEVDVGQFVVRCTQCNSSGDYYGTELGARSAWDDRRGYNKKKILQLIAFDIFLAVVYFCLSVLIIGIIKLF